METTTTEATELKGAIPTVQLWLFGHLQIRIDGRPVDQLLSGRAQSVLEHLALAHPRPMPRDVLLGSLWPEMDAARARSNLNVAVSAIRRGLAAPSLVAFDRRRCTYGLGRSIDVWIDVVDFTRHMARARAEQAAARTDAAIDAYRRAGELYTDDLLADQPYATWLDAQRRDLRRTWLDGLSSLGRLLEGAGLVDEAIWAFEHATRVDPLDEATLRRWMLAVAARGEWRRALGAFEEHRVNLSDELGLLPSLSLRRTADEILTSSGVLTS